MFVESHRHLSGSIRPETVWEIIKDADRLDIAGSLSEVQQQMYLTHELVDFEYFCTRFDILDKITWTNRAVAAVAKQVCADIKADQIKHATLTLSLNKFVMNGDLIAAGERVFHILDEAAIEADLNLNYLLSVSYNWPQELQIRTINCCQNLGRLVAGIDFVSDEHAAKWGIYPDLLKPWHDQDKTVRAHVAERPGTGRNIQKAIHEMRVTRIAHGIHGTTEEWADAVKSNIVFDVSLHSNIITNAINLVQHPIKRMLSAGCQVVLGTDDPVQFNCSLQGEYNLAEVMGVDKATLRQMAYESRIR